jgi:hypothetical protein
MDIKRPSSMEKMNEDIVYFMSERHSRKVSEPKATIRITATWLILDYLEETLVLLEPLFYRVV